MTTTSTEETGTEVTPYLPQRTLEAIPGTVTITSLVLDEDLSYERWERTGELLGNLMKANGWWLGDWFVHGEDHKEWGETYTQAINETGLGYSTLANYAWVSRYVTPERRRPELTWTHHQAVAKLKPAQQVRWLDHAVAGEWTVAELKAEIAKHYNGKTETSGIDKAVSALEKARKSIAEADELEENRAIDAIVHIDEAIKTIRGPVVEG